MPKRVVLLIALGFGIVAGAACVRTAEGNWWIKRLNRKPSGIYVARIQLIHQSIHIPILKAPDDKTGTQTTGLDFSHILHLSKHRKTVLKLLQNPALDAEELNAALKSNAGPYVCFIICAMLDHSQSQVRIDAARLLATPAHVYHHAAAALLAAARRNNYPLGPENKAQLEYRKALWGALEKITGVKLVPIKPKSTTRPSDASKPDIPPNILPPQAFDTIQRWLIEVLCLWGAERSAKLQVEGSGGECLLNLSTGMTSKPASDIRNEAARNEWYKKINLNLICKRRKTDKGPMAVLESIGIRTVPFKPSDDCVARITMGISAVDASDLIENVKPSSVVLQDTFVFKATGSVGVLKVTHADKNGISFRYRFASDAKAFHKHLLTPPSVSFGPFEPEEPKEPERPKKPARKLKTVRRFKAFDQMLKKNRFAVTPEQFPQIFTAYIPESWDRENALPPFITTDSAWETYHVLLEEGVKQIEQYQAVRLKRFSRRLLDRATSLAAHGQRDFARIAEYASIALALQDKKHAAMLPKTRKQLLSALKEGVGTVRGPVGFPLSAAAFRANSFYTSSPKLADYFSARQWYAMVVFPVGDKEATSLAIRLTMLIDSDKELRGLWDALSAPYDSLLAKAEDGDVAAYASAIRKIVGPKATSAQAIASVGALQKHLQTALGDPQVNDQLFDIEQHANFAKLTKGFRLLPPRRLTSSVCFQKTTPPDTSFPSALNFMVACKQMRSPAAVRALQQQVSAKRAREIQRGDPVELPDSLHGRAIKLIATLQNPPPAAAPKALKTEAWADKQLWTQLGAWAQQRHTWALHAKMTHNPLGGPEPSDAGMVSPYPDFFESLGALARQTAAILPNKIDIKVLSKSLLHHVETYTSCFVDTRDRQYGPSMERLLLEDHGLNRIHGLLDECRDEHQTLLGFSVRPSDARILKHLGDLARKCLEAGKASKQDTAILRRFARSGDGVVNLMGQFADICDKLASIARKQLAGKPLNTKENRLIRNYGPILARLHFYENFACVDPDDDSPIISPVFVNPLAERTLYAALGRPHALYVLGKLNGKTRLMRGAVLGYREFTHPISDPLDDDSWREMVWSGKPIPQPPAFTKSFMVHPDEDEIVAMLKRDEIYSGIDNVPGEKITQAIIAMLPKAGRYIEDQLIGHLGARCTEQDAPAFLKLMRQYVENPPEKQIRTARDIIVLTANTPCKAVAPQLMQMLAAKNANHANAAAVVLFCQPNLIDVSLMAPAYDKLSDPRRALACFLLGHLPKPNQAATTTMLKALQDKNASLRWHGATALGRSKSKAPAVITALRKRIDDSNDYVASASLDALSKLGVFVEANTLIDKLKRYCRNPGWPEVDESARKAIETPSQGPVSVLADDPFYIAPAPSRLDIAILTTLIQMKHRRAIPAIMEIMTGDRFSWDYMGFVALKKLDRQGYPDRLLDLAFNKEMDIDLRVDAMGEIAECDSAQKTCRKLIPLLSDKTPISKDLDLWKRKSLGDVAVGVIADSMDLTVDIITVPSEDGLLESERDFPQEFKMLREKVRKWARTATRPADK